MLSVRIPEKPEAADVKKEREDREENDKPLHPRTSAGSDLIELAALPPHLHLVFHDLHLDG